MRSLRVTEIFYSLQGETSFVGLPTVFIRLTGCPLRCNYCDTSYAFTGGSHLSVEQILAAVSQYQTTNVTVTGGEPLAQQLCLRLLEQLCDQSYTVSLETSGALDVSAVDRRVVKIIDLKTPGSGECTRNLYANLKLVAASDQVKFVICDRNDYEWAKSVIADYNLIGNTGLLLSPAYEQLAPRELAQWILDDQLPVRMQLQMHKLIWGDIPGR